MRNRFISGAFTFLFALLFTNAYSQGVGPSDKIKIIPPAPDVAAFQRFGKVPVSLYTGIPTIAVPVYTVKMGDIEIPVSINYHASGIKVTDEASRVGLGWALSAGGVITRTIMNMDDFASRDDAYHFNTTIPDLEAGFRGDPGAAINIQGADVNGGNCHVMAPNGGTDVNAYVRDEHDYEPDVYSYNFLGYSGTFILKRNKEAVLLQNEKMKITWLPANSGSWEIKTADGATYLFEEHDDYIDYFNVHSGGGSEISSWFLTKITSPKGDTASFIYQKFADRIRIGGSFFESLVPVEVLSTGAAPCLGYDGLVYYYYNLPNKEYSKMYLDKINFDNGSLSFFYSNRDDIEFDVKLDSIRLAQESGAVIKRWQFGYEYFEGIQDQDRDGGTLATRSKRLKLKTFTEKGINNEAVNPYVFSYNNDGNSNAPQKTSFARDHWGYFNGKYSNAHLAPTTVENHAQKMTAKLIGVFQDTRDVDPGYNQVFMLKEMTYPTKGKTVFEYETNDFDIVQSNTKDHSYFANYPEVIEKQISKMYSGQVHTEQPSSAQTADYLLDLSDMYIDPLLQNPTSAVNLTAFFRYNGTSFSPCLMSSSVDVKLCKEDGTILSEADVAFFIGQTTMPMTTCVQNPDSSYYIGAQFKNLYNLLPGKYLWKVTIGSGVSYIEDVSLKIVYYANKVQQDIINNGVLLSGADFGGGLRIKRILQYDNINPAPINIKQYQYNYVDEHGKTRSFGKRMARPVYAYFDEKFYSQDCLDGTQDFRTWTREIQSESLVPVENPISGAAIGYDQVIEYDGENGEYGKTVYQFENEPNLILDYSSNDYIWGSFEQIPRKPPTSCTIPNYGNGNMLTQTDYKNMNGDYVKVKEVSNVYTDYYPGNTSVLYGVEKRMLNGVIPTPFCQFNAFVYPAIARSRDLLTSTTTKVYDESGEVPTLAQTTSYEYNHTTHLQTTSVSTTDSKGRVNITSYKYPLDYDDLQDDNAIELMKGSLYMHDKPIVTEQSIIDGGVKKITGLDITKYAFNATANTVLPAEIASLDLTAPVLATSVPAYVPATNTYPTGVTPKVDFTNYNSKGNITQMNKVNDINTVYVWDYKNNLPVASVTNASADRVFYTSFETADLIGWTLSGTTTIVNFPPGNSNGAVTGRSVLSKTFSTSPASISRTGLPAGNYIVSFFGKNGNITVNGAMINPTFGFADWGYYQYELTNVTSVTISFPFSLLSQPSIDELRLYPKGALMTTYTYNPLIGVISICNPAARVSQYEYDGLSRLKYIRGHDGVILKSFDYHYKQ